MALRDERPPDDPLRDELSRLANEYGDQELFRACLSVVARYAELGARNALVKRRGDPSIQCDACRERKALADQLDRTIRKAADNARSYRLGGSTAAAEGGE